MSYGHDEGPVYYREIQKNAYLKRIPNEPSGSKLRPLGQKKPPLKPMWTLFCVHNGRSPYLEQYPLAECGATLAHAPAWRACLRTARHVTASVKPHAGEEYDFLVDTDHGPVRMRAPDWDSMQDWVVTLRNKLHELRILSKGENVYCAAPAAPPPRAAARDPTSPLPPTPPVPPDRVPGIELTTPPIRPTVEELEPETPTPELPVPGDVDISSWDETSPLPGTSGPAPLPGTSQDKVEPKKSLTKICGQNICLDDSILRRSATTDSDEEFFSEIDRISDEADRLDLEGGYRQTLLVADEGGTPADTQSNQQSSNITVIQVSNKPPHTAIPVLGPETHVFDFSFARPETEQSFVNIVNTEVNINSENGYGTVFSNDSDYGHLSLTTTVNLTDVRNDDAVKLTDRGDVYERLCMASTSDAVTKIKKMERVRKSSLPNLDVSTNEDSAYEYLFPSRDNNRNTTVTVNNDSQNGRSQNSQIDTQNSQNGRTNPQTVHNSQIESQRAQNSQTDLQRVQNSQTDLQRVQNSQTDLQRVHNSQTDLQRVHNSQTDLQRVHNSQIDLQRVQNPQSDSQVRQEISQNGRSELPSSDDRNQSAVTVGGNLNLNSRVIRSNVERSHSQNAYDSNPRARESACRRVQNNSPKREGRSDKSETSQAKPIWKRGLTELSFLTRLRGIGQARRHQSPTGQDTDNDRSASSPVKVVHRSRPEARVESTRRRSSSLSNGQSPPAAAASSALIPLRRRQALALQAEQRRRAAIPATVPSHNPPLLAEYDKRVWIAWWPVGGSRCNGRMGDRLAAVRAAQPRDLQHARQLFKTSPTPLVDLLFHRVPLGKIYILNKRDQESIGLKLDGECNIVSVDPSSPSARAGLPPPGRWAVTEVNNRPINLIKGGEEEMTRLSLHGTEVSILIQPAALVKKLRSVIKANKTLLSIR